VTTASPALPVKPLIQAKRSPDGSTYSPRYSSERGTTKPSTPASASRFRSACSRLARSCMSRNPFKKH
jgi:hypothetical protein